MVRVKDSKSYPTIEFSTCNPETYESGGRWKYQVALFPFMFGYALLTQVQL
jgi:hypothetical protein